MHNKFFHPAGFTNSGRVFIILLVLCLSLLSAIPVSAYPMPANVRVGLERQFKEKDIITIFNNALWVGYELSGQFTVMGMLQSAGGFTARPENTVCVQLPGVYATYDQALAVANAYATGYAPALGSNGDWLVYNTGFASENAARNEAAAVGGVVIPISAKRIVLYAGSKPVAVFDNAFSAVQVKDAYGGNVSLGGASYRGVVELGRYTGQKMTAVNVLSVDEYLYSVVPSEMPASFQPEALKAQAVAARSYTLTRMGVHREQGYDICDQSHCQNYQGADKENAAATRAVSDTTGKVACYEGKPINAVFFSSSGGATDNSENVWTNPLPYLRGVTDINEYEPRIWTRTFTLNELSVLLTQNNVNIGTVSAVEITRTDASGRVQSMTIYGSTGTKVLTKEEIRTFFNASAGGMLESRNFTLANAAATIGGTSVSVTDGGQTQTIGSTSLYALSQTGIPVAIGIFSASNGQAAVTYGASQPVVSSGGNVVFTGRGWGHGVGMSQRGAEGLARLGYDYISILKHYYTGITVD